MKTKLLFVSLLALYAGSVLAQNHEGRFSLCPPRVEEQWVLSLGGTGSSKTSSGGDSILGADLSIGRTFNYILPVEAGLRQTVSFSSQGKDTTIASSAAYADVTVLTLCKKLDLFVGGNAGITYGNTTPIWEAAPEGGLRYWLKQDVAIIGRVDYPFDLDKGRGEERLRYFLGLQVKF